MNNEGVRKAVEIIDYDKLDPELISKIKIENQRRAMLKIVENEGYEKAKIEIAAKMKAKGIDVAVISEISGLSAAEVEKL